MTNMHRALADPVRRGIIRLLAKEKRTQSEIVKQFEISQPAIAKHLRVLKEEGLISEVKEGRYRIYQLERQQFSKAYEEMLREMDLLLGETLDNLKNHVERRKGGSA